MKRFFVYLFVATGMLLSINDATSCPYPPYDFYPPQGWEGQGTETAQLSPTCIIHFSYCYRTVRDALGNPLYYDANVWHFWVEGDCSGVNLEPEHYKNIFEVCLAELVTRTPNYWGAEIPECPIQSEVFRRISAPSCWTSPFWKWVKDEQTGNTVRRLVSYACIQSPETIGYCYSIFRYCIDKGTLIPTLIKSGYLTPQSGMQCVGMFTDPDTGIHYPCNPICEETE